MPCSSLLANLIIKAHNNSTSLIIKQGTKVVEVAGVLYNGKCEEGLETCHATRWVLFCCFRL